MIGSSSILGLFLIIIKNNKDAFKKDIENIQYFLWSLLKRVKNLTLFKKLRDATRKIIFYDLCKQIKLHFE